MLVEVLFIRHAVRVSEILEVATLLTKKSYEEFRQKDTRGRAAAVLANAVMFSRLALLPPLLTKLADEKWTWGDTARAGALFLTDCLDGKIARKFGGETTFGAYTDPLIDKFATNCLEAILVTRGEMSAHHSALRIARDIESTRVRTKALLAGEAPNATKAGKRSSALRMGVDVLSVSPLAHRIPRIMSKLHDTATAGLIASGTSNELHFRRITKQARVESRTASHQSAYDAA